MNTVCYFLRQEDAALDSATPDESTVPKLTTSAIEKDILVTRYFFVSIIKSKGSPWRCFYAFEIILHFFLMELCECRSKYEVL